MDESAMDTESACLSSRPSAEQVTAVVEYMEQHPDLANNKMRNGVNRQKAKQMWAELSELLNSIPGSIKTVDGWIRFWIDKKCMTKAKKKSIDEGTNSGLLTPIEEKIWALLKESGNTTIRKKRPKKEASDEEEYSSSDEVLSKKKKQRKDKNIVYAEPLANNDIDERQTVVMEELVQVMDRQAVALAQVAQASASNAQALEKLAEASLIQARAVESLAGSLSNIGVAALDVRAAIMSIDYSMKRCYNVNQT